MKPIVKKILEAGLVDKHTALMMEKWKSVDSGAAELVGKEDIRKVSASSLVQFAEEIEELLEGERNNLQETKLAISVGQPFLAHWVLPPVEGPVVVFRDEMQNFIFPTREWMGMVVGNRFRVADGAVWEIAEVIALHVGDLKYAYQVTATELDLN